MSAFEPTLKVSEPSDAVEASSNQEYAPMVANHGHGPRDRAGSAPVEQGEILIGVAAGVIVEPLAKSYPKQGRPRNQ
jgi:hypothetical protein